MIKTYLYIQLSYQLCIVANFVLNSESYKIGIFFLPSILIMTIIFKQIEKIDRNRRALIGQTAIN